MIVYIENHKDVTVLMKEKNCRSVEQNRETRKRLPRIELTELLLQNKDNAMKK